MSDIKLRECREAFEAWCATKNESGMLPTRIGDDYFHRETQIAWASWQASSRHTDHLLEMAVEALLCWKNVDKAYGVDGKAKALRGAKRKGDKTLLTLQKHLGKE